MSFLKDFSENRCVEPEKRLFQGKFQYAIHRFPIKNGITIKEATLKDMNISIFKNSQMKLFLDKIQEKKT